MIFLFSDNSVELSASAYSGDSSENATPLRKVLFPVNKSVSATKKEVHFHEEIEVLLSALNVISVIW